MRATSNPNKFEISSSNNDGHLEAPDVADQFEEGELAIWWHNLATAEAAGHFNNGVTIFTAVGRK